MQLIYTAEHLEVLCPCASNPPTLESGGTRDTPGYVALAPMALLLYHTLGCLKSIKSMIKARLSQCSLSLQVTYHRARDMYAAKRITALQRVDVEKSGN